MNNYQVIVGNIGIVYDGSDPSMARLNYEEYKNQSIMEYGRVANESVILIKNNEIIEEHFSDIVGNI